MTAEELVLKVAEAFCCPVNGCEEPRCVARSFEAEARAAIAIVVEACAKVAEAPVNDPDQWNRDGYVTQYQAKSCVAAAIRAIMEKKE